MKSCRLAGLFLFLLSQMSWAGLIELKGSGVTAFSSSNPVSAYSSPIAFATSFTIDTDAPDSNVDLLGGFFLNAIKSGSVILNSGHQYDLDLSDPDAGNVETKAFIGGTEYAIGTMRFYLKFIDTLGDILTLRYFSHTDPAYDDAGFVDAGTSLHGLENNVWFEGGGEICISNCATSTVVNAEFHTVPVVTVPEPQPLILLLLGILGIVLKRFKNNSSCISN